MTTNVNCVALGGRRVRGGRARANVPARSDGPSLEELAESGIKVDILCCLTSKDSDTKATKALIPYDQLMVRGEDLTSLMFAQLPRASTASSERAESGAGGSEQGELEKDEEMSGTSTPSSKSTSTKENERYIFFCNILGTRCEPSHFNIYHYSTAYTELGDGQLMEILNQHLHQSSDAFASLGELVLFKGAIEHSTRICRALVSDIYQRIC